MKKDQTQVFQEPQKANATKGWNLANLYPPENELTKHQKCAILEVLKSYGSESTIKENTKEPLEQFKS